MTQASLQARRRTLIRTRRSTAILGATALAMAGLVATGGPALAVHDKQMQLDGNTVDDSSLTPAYDWESFFDNSGTGGDLNAKSGALPTDFVARGFKVDYQLPEATTFATGSKDTLNIGAIPAAGGAKATAAGWQCGNSNNLGAKDDLMNVYTVAYRDPTTHHILLYFGAEKSSNLGDNNIGIWFLQDSAVNCTVPSTGRNTDFSGHHRPGDVLLTAAFTNGGEVATVESHVWESGTENGGEGHLGSAQSGFKCGNTETALGAYACAITNDSVNQPPDGSIDPPWNQPAKTPGSIDSDSLAAQEFYEGGIDITQAAINAEVSEPCITSFLADTRSSQSPTATLFDYARGSFPVCKPSTTMQGTGLTPTQDKTTVHANENVTYTFYEKNDGDISLNSPYVTTDDSNCSTATSKLNTTNDPATTRDETQFNVGDTNYDTKLSPNEIWQFTCTTSYAAGTSTGTIVAIGHGTDPLSSNDVTYYTTGSPAVACTEGTVSSGKLCDPQERATASVTLVNPGTTLREEVSASLTFTYYERNTGDIRISGSSVNITSNCSGSGTATSVNQTDDPATTPLDESTLNVGDANDDTWLDPGETWTFTCTKSLAAPYASPSASFSDTGTGHGTDELGRAVPTTNESDSSSVVLTNATPNPWPTSSP